MGQFVIIRNLKTGAQKRVSQETVRLMPKNLLKVWQVVGDAPEKAATGNGKAAQAATMRESILPEEIREMHVKAEHEARLRADSEMISGVVAPATQPQAPEAVAPAKPAKGAAPEPEPKPEPEPAQEAPAQPVKAAEVIALPNMGAKAAEALAAAGLGTFKALAESDAAEINKVLDAAGLGAKRAQVPSWKTKAAEKAQGE